MALSLFWNWDRSFWHWTTIPVGRWVIRMADEVLLMQVFVSDVQVDLVFDVGHDVQGYEGGLALALGVEGGNAY